MYHSVYTLDFDLLTAVALHVKQELLRMHNACVQLRVALSGDILMSLMTGASSFQGVGLERFHCIQRHLYEIHGS